MSKHFFEIQKGNFIASEKNKVNDVNLIIEDQGQIISLLGPSGIGKTTILRTIAGLQKLNSGNIFLKGRLIASEKIVSQKILNLASKKPDYPKVEIELLAYNVQYISGEFKLIDHAKIDWVNKEKTGVSLLKSSGTLMYEQGIEIVLFRNKLLEIGVSELMNYIAMNVQA